MSAAIARLSTGLESVNSCHGRAFSAPRGPAWFFLLVRIPPESSMTGISASYPRSGIQSRNNRDSGLNTTFLLKGKRSCRQGCPGRTPLFFSRQQKEARPTFRRTGGFNSPGAFGPDLHCLLSDVCSTGTAGGLWIMSYELKVIRSGAAWQFGS